MSALDELSILNTILILVIGASALWSVTMLRRAIEHAARSLERFNRILEEVATTQEEFQPHVDLIVSEVRRIKERLERIDPEPPMPFT